MKRFYTTISIKVELEADTHEDAALLLEDWAIHAMQHDYVEPISVLTNLIQEMSDGKEESTTKNFLS